MHSYRLFRLAFQPMINTIIIQTDGILIMITLPSKEVRKDFGRVADIVKGGESVTVTQSGEPTLMILPFAEAMEAQRLYKAFRLVQFMKGLPSDHSAPALSLEEINTLVHELRP